MAVDLTRTFKPINIALLTVSDTRTVADDTSGDILAERIRNAGHHLVARIHQRLHRQHQGIDAPGGHGNALSANRCASHSGPMARRHGLGDGLAQAGQAQVVCVKGFALLQGIHGRLPDEIGRDLVALAKPEGQHIGAVQAGIGHFADFGGLQVQDGRAHGLLSCPSRALHVAAGRLFGLRRRQCLDHAKAIA